MVYDMNTGMSKRQVWVVTIGCFLSYFLFGLVDNMKGQTLPVLMEDGAYSYSTGGTIIFSEYTGFFIATFLGGILADLFGKKSTLIIAGICLSVGVTGYAASTQLVTLIGFIFLIGLGLGMLELSGSNIISGIHDTKKAGFYLNLLNSLYGVGAILTPMAVGAMLGIGFSWRTVYRMSLTLVIPILLYFIFMKYPKEKGRQKEYHGIQVGETMKLISKREVWMMYVFIFAYVAAEIAVATWFIEFLQTEKQLGGEMSAAYFSAYFALFMLGRILGSFFVDRVGYLRSLIIFAAVSAVGLCIGIWGTSKMAWLLSGVGFGFSIIFPTATAALLRIPSKNSGTMLGSFFACGGLGGMVGPWLVGMVSESAGLRFGMMVNVGYCLVMIVSAALLMRENILEKMEE